MNQRQIKVIGLWSSPEIIRLKRMQKKRKDWDPDKSQGSRKYEIIKHNMLLNK